MSEITSTHTHFPYANSEERKLLVGILSGVLPVGYSVGNPEHWVEVIANLKRSYDARESTGRKTEPSTQIIATTDNPDYALRFPHTDHTEELILVQKWMMTSPNQASKVFFGR